MRSILRGSRVESTAPPSVGHQPMQHRSCWDTRSMDQRWTYGACECVVCGLWRGDTVSVCGVWYTTLHTLTLFFSLFLLSLPFLPPSSGVNMYAMLTGCLPYTVEPFNITTLHAKMLENKMNPIPDHLSASESTLTPENLHKF